MADDHGDHREAAAAAPEDGLQRREQLVGRQPLRGILLQLAGEDVEQHLGIGAGIQVAAIAAHQLSRQLGDVGQVAVVPEADAKGGIHVERLGFVDAVAAGRRVAHVADADVAHQLQHVALVEDVAHQAGFLAHRQLVLAHGHDAGRILAAVLQHRQRVIDPLVDRRRPDDAD
jgi:hypothetical protein